FEEWYSGMESINSILQYVRGEVEIGKEQVKLSRALSLPKFATGYMSEKVVGEHFQGVMFGVSIPLWENKNKQKYAEAQVEASLLVLEDSKVQFYNRLRSLYLKASVMQQNIAQYRREIEASRNDLLLQKALDSGEISLLSYLLEIGYYYDALVKALENEREYQLVLAELNAVAL
ncbi:MAG: TolC family protein, partial [Bacteroidales bacterium]|nr:TolC family protein [Bacteroidales bacterium]